MQKYRSEINPYSRCLYTYTFGQRTQLGSWVHYPKEMVDKWPKIFILLKLNLWIHASSHDTNLNFFEWAIFDDDTLGWRLDSRMTDKGLSLSHPICFHFWVYEFRVGIRISKRERRDHFSRQNFWTFWMAAISTQLTNCDLGQAGKRNARKLLISRSNV